jgi:hypothetical protein
MHLIPLLAPQGVTNLLRGYDCVLSKGGCNGNELIPIEGLVEHADTLSAGLSVGLDHVIGFACVDLSQYRAVGKPSEHI